MVEVSLLIGTLILLMTTPWPDVWRQYTTYPNGLDTVH